MCTERSESFIGIFTTDANLVIRSWDEWMERVTGISSESACGKRIEELFPDLERRGLLDRLRRVIEDGTAEILAPAFHEYLIPAHTQAPSRYFTQMQQRVTIAPLVREDLRVGTVVTIEDVTARLDSEREASEKLQSGDEGTRLQAAQTLSAREDHDSTESLIGALHDESWRVREVAVQGLVRQGSPKAVTALLKSLRTEHENIGVVNSALHVLTMINLDTVTPLVHLLSDPDEELRIFSALALGEARDPRAIPALLKALDDPDVNVCYHTIEALGKLRASEGVERLCAIAISGNFFLAYPALDALTRIGDPRIVPRVMPLLEDEMLRGPVAELLGRIGDWEIILPLAERLNTGRVSAQIIAAAFVALYARYEQSYGEGDYIANLVHSAINESGLRNLVTVSRDAREDELRSIALTLSWLEGPLVERTLVQLLGRTSVQKEIVEALVRYGRRITDLLLEQLKTEDPQVREAAVIALGRIGDAKAVPSLIRILESDEDLFVPTANALAQIGNGRACEAFLTFLDHPRSSVRQASISALNSIGHPGMTQAVCRLLRDSSPRLRESAVKIAGYFGYPECTDAVLDLCNDDDEGVRSTAVEQAVFFDDERVSSVVFEMLSCGTAKVRTAAARALVYLEDPQVLSQLLAALDDTDPWVRYFSVRSLEKKWADMIWSARNRQDEVNTGIQQDAEGRMDIQAKKGELLERLFDVINKDSATPVRLAAIDAAGMLGGAEAIGFLSSLSEEQERDISRAALTALGHIKHPAALGPIIKVLHSRHASSIRLDALHALDGRSEIEVVRALVWVTADGDPEVAQTAMEILSRTVSPEAIAALVDLTADPKRGESALISLTRVGSDRIDWVARGLTHSDIVVRSAIVKVLARMKHPRATERLLEALDDVESSVRLTAVAALKDLGNRSGEVKLAELARSDPDVAVRYAARALLRVS